MTTVQPVSAPYAKPFTWLSGATIASNVVGANVATDQIQVLPDSFFLLTAFLGETNYDNVTGEMQIFGVDTDNPHIYGPPRVPNNFEVFIRENSKDNLMGTPMPQACICSNGYLAGNQLPFPLLFKPMTQFDFEFYNVAPTLLLDSADPAVAKDLEITFGMQGYNVPAENLEAFLAAWPAYGEKARTGQPLWLRNFTRMSIPGLT